MKYIFPVVAVLALVIAGISLVAPREAGQVEGLGSLNNATSTITNPHNFTEDLAIGSGFWVAGVGEAYKKTTSLNSATTTVCALQSPDATSTLAIGSISLSVSSTTASTLTLARATTAFATTTVLGYGSVAANARADVAVMASTTGSSVASGFLFPPNTYFVVGMQGGVGTFSPTGVCQAHFTTISR